MFYLCNNWVVGLMNARNCEWKQTRNMTAIGALAFELEKMMTYNLPYITKLWLGYGTQI